MGRNRQNGRRSDRERERKRENASGRSDEPRNLQLLELGEHPIESLFNDESSHKHIRMSVDVLGHRVKDDIDALGDRVGVVRGGEGGVDEDERFGRVGVGDSDESGDGDDSEGWVGGGFDPDQLGRRKRGRREKGTREGGEFASSSTRGRERKSRKSKLERRNLPSCYP